MSAQQKSQYTMPQHPINDAAMGHSVSYASVAFTDGDGVISRGMFTNFLTRFEQLSLLDTAYETIQHAIDRGQYKQPNPLLYPICSSMTLKQNGIFVTLRKRGELRGCIGQIISPLPLCRITPSIALATAFEDSRFKPVTRAELPDITVDIAVLQAPYRVPHYKHIVIGQDGIILKKISSKDNRMHSALFLPEVPQEFGWGLSETLQHLSLKAGLDKNEWEDATYELFKAFHFSR